MSIGEVLILVILLGLVGWSLKQHLDFKKKELSPPTVPPTFEELEATLNAYHEYVKNWYERNKTD